MKEILISILEDDQAQILVIEDYIQSIGSVIRMELHDYSIRFTIHKNGVAFLNALETMPDIPNLCILDIRVPRKSGIEVLREIRSKRQYEEMPIVMFSSSPVGHESETAYSLGAQGYVEKPNGAEEMGQALIKIIEEYAVDYPGYEDGDGIDSWTKLKNSLDLDF